MAEAAKIIGALGGIGIDLNMGCCAPEIVKQGAGISWMLKDKSETEQMIRMVKKAINKNMRLSVKMRLGDENYNMKDLCNFVDMLIFEGTTQIVLHPRTRKSKFRYQPHWQNAEYLFEYVEKYNNSVECCINGDIVDFQSLCNVRKAVIKSKGFMIGRAAVQKPWIFGVIAQKLKEEKDSDFVHSQKKAENIDSLELVCEFLDNLTECQPEEFWISRAKRFFAYFCKNFEFGHYLETQINNAKDLNKMKKVFESYFEKMPNERFLYRC